MRNKRRPARRPRPRGPSGPWAAVRLGAFTSAAAAGLVLAGAPATAAAAGPAPSVAAAGSATALGPWAPVGLYLALSAHADEGVATITKPGGRSEVVLRGDRSLSASLKGQGWSHIGDPGGWHGYLVDAYQGGPGHRSKLFRLTTPSGATYDFVHALAAGERPNNSFAAISPDGRWMVSGDWWETTRLLVFPSPTTLVAQAVSGNGTLALAGTISLDRPVRDVQGCTFTSSTQLLCSSDDPGHDLWPTPYQLLQVTLAAPLDGQATTAAQVISLGELPVASACPGQPEVEGIDYQVTTGLVRVEVVQPGVCDVVTTIYEYSRKYFPKQGQMTGG